ncbi:MAG TPA: hypothetical protein VKB05_01770 [Pyrinomonadaceae bacterium]|nr:hypothetical protein [Pyrinomonadaceae bacterium]
MCKRFQIFSLVALLVANPLAAYADITISLTRGFVKKNKDRATISTTFEVNKFHKKPNRIGVGSDDGDVHIAGRDTVVSLPIVAEILNGKLESDTFNFLLGIKDGQSVPLVGVWRLWFEHPGNEDQIQGATVAKPDDTNPDHVFEFHPVTKFGNFDCRDSLLPIVDAAKEFRGHPAEKAFASYEQRPGTISKTNNGIMITSNQAGFNYVEFQMKLAGNPKEVSDGFIVLANVFNVGASDDEEPLTEQPRRMIFVKGSPPGDTIATMSNGDTLHVLGIPRVNLNEVLAIADGLPGHDEFAFGGLPYELIIVAVLGDE